MSRPQVATRILSCRYLGRRDSYKRRNSASSLRNGRSTGSAAQRRHNSSAGASRKIVTRPSLSSRDEISSCTKAPPPKAAIKGRPCADSASSSRSAASSLCRNPASPDCSKISGMLRASRARMRSSKSSKCQPSRSPSARPTLVFPAPMKPTRKMARTGTARAGAFTSWREPGVAFMLVLASLRLPSLGFLAFLEVDSTTEGSQPYRGCRLVDGACEGTPLFYQEGSVDLWLEGNVILDQSAHGLGFYID